MPRKATLMGAYDRIKRGKAADLGEIPFRSSWERNVCRVIKHRVEQGEIDSWAYEPERFFFPGVLRGATSYLPDFLVVYPNGQFEYWEVKGRELPKDRTRWRRMGQHYPHLKLVVIGAPLYRAWSQAYGGLPHWEH